MAERSGNIDEKGGTRFFITVAVISLFLILINNGCSEKAKVEQGFSFTFVEAVPLVIDGFELSAPLLIPDVEYGGVFIAAGNTNIISRYDPLMGLKKHIEPATVPEGVEGVGAFCNADGDFFFRPATGGSYRKTSSNRLYQLTGGGRIRLQELPAEVTEDVEDFGLLVYLGDGRLFIETDPKGPFAIVDFVANEVERQPASFPERGSIDVMIPDYGAREVYRVRRASDMSVFFQRFPFKGAYRGVEYISKREFFAAAATVNGLHLLQYASGEVLTYDFLYKQIAISDLAKLTETEYTLMLNMTIVGSKAYLVGIRGPVINPEGNDLLIFELKGNPGKL